MGTEVAWRRPSGCANSECVEVAGHGWAVLVRQSQHPAEELMFYRPEWATFIAAVKAGEYDDLLQEWNQL